MSDEAAATLMNRLSAARHTDIMVPAANGWNCCARDKLIVDAAESSEQATTEREREDRIDLLY